MNILDFQKKKLNGEKIVMVSCYDFWSAQLVSKTPVDAILVGDSVSMVNHGYQSTLQADLAMMELHTQAVLRGAGEKFIVADMPFLSFRKGLLPAMEAVELLMKTGAHAVKIEACEGHEDIIQHIVQSGVPVMGHLGLTPQSVHALGGYKVQGREELMQKKILHDAKKLEELGCFSLVLECVPTLLAQSITKSLNIPTIGIGAGSAVDGQILVLNDLLGFGAEPKPKFLRKYFNGREMMSEALVNYANDVKSSHFPNEEESYS